MKIEIGRTEVVTIVKGSSDIQNIAAFFKLTLFTSFGVDDALTKR